MPYVGLVADSSSYYQAVVDWTDSKSLYGPITVRLRTARMVSRSARAFSLHSCPACCLLSILVSGVPGSREQSNTLPMQGRSQARPPLQRQQSMRLGCGPCTVLYCASLC